MTPVSVFGEAGLVRAHPAGIGACSAAPHLVLGVSSWSGVLPGGEMPAFCTGRNVPGVPFPWDGGPLRLGPHHPALG